MSTHRCQTHVLRLSHAHFPWCPGAEQHMTTGRRADMAVHVPCTLLFLCLSVCWPPFITDPSSAARLSDAAELTPCWHLLDSEADSWVTRPGLCGRITAAEAKQADAGNTAVCAGLEWAERVTPGWVWRHCNQLILSLVKKQHATAVQSEKWGCWPSGQDTQGIWPG